MSEFDLPAGSPWLAGAVPRPMRDEAWPQGAGGGRQSYPLVVRDHGLKTAIGLLLRSLPYALARFAIILGCTIGCTAWLGIGFGGTVWLSTHVTQAFGWVWLLFCLSGAGWLWVFILRGTLHLIECGHVAVLTELITHGQVANGRESMFAYGRRVVLSRFEQVTLLYGLNALIRGVIQGFIGTIDGIGMALPIPGLETLASLAALVLRAATRYLDKAIFSYNLARHDQDPWAGARDGIVYYCQNAKPILHTSVWIVVLERALTFLLFLALLVPAGAITMALSPTTREVGGFVAVIGAMLLTGALRAAFVKPLFLIMIMVRFHTLIEHQPINQAWTDRLSQISEGFRELDRRPASA